MKKLFLALALLSSCGLQALTQADQDLLWAAQTHNVNILIAALHNGAHVNGCDSEGSTALSFAAQYGSIAIAAGLIEYHGVKVNTADFIGWTPLHHAAANGHTAIVALLLTYEASVDAADTSNFTPLHLALEAGHHDCITLLLNHGADKHRKNSEGWSFFSMVLRNAFKGTRPPVVKDEDACAASCDEQCTDDCDCKN